MTALANLTTQQCGLSTAPLPTHPGFFHDVFTFMLGGFTGGLILVGCYLAYVYAQTRHSDMREAVELTRQRLQQLFGADRGGLPGWLLGPDVDQAEWMNTAMEGLWPHIDRAATTWAFTDHNLETLLNSQTFWKPAWLANSGVVLQALMLGQKSPRVTGIKVYPANREGTRESVIVDISFDWASKMQVQLAMKTLQNEQMGTLDKFLKFVFRTITVKVVVRDLVARGKVRVTLGPLLDKLPVVGAARVSFLEPPAVSYHVSSFGANPMLIPGLEGWVNSFIRDQVLQPFTFPEAFVLDVGQLLGLGSTAGSQAVRPEGLLSVTVHRAENVPRMDWFGLSDPYVKAFLSDRVKMSTLVKANTLWPVWEEQFEFVVHSASHQRLTLELWDSDALRQDDEIGRVQVPLSSLDLQPGVVNELALVVHRPDSVQQEDSSQPRVQDVGSRSTAGSPAQSGGLEDDLGKGDVQGGLEWSESAAPSVQPTLKQARTTRIRRLKRQAQRGLDALYTKDCLVHVTVQYFPFSSSEANAAMDATAGLRPSLTSLSPRMRRLLGGGMLYVHLVRAQGLPAGRAITKKFRIKVKVGPAHGDAVYKKVAERTGLGQGLQSRDPVFDQMVDFLVDGTTAHAPDAQVTVEISVAHLVLRPTTKGRVTLPLARVLSAGRLSDTFMLEGPGGGGRLEMGLEWLATMQAV